MFTWAPEHSQELLAGAGEVRELVWEGRTHPPVATTMAISKLALYGKA